MQTVLISAALLTNSAFAGECHVDFDAHVKIANEQVVVALQDNKQLTLSANEAWLDGKKLSLSKEQQTLMDEYYSRVFNIAPQAADIALDAVDLATKGVSMAFSTLLGEDDQVVQDITGEFSVLRTAVQSQFYAEDGSVRFDSKSMQDGDFIDKEFSQRFEKKVESLVEKSMGSIMITIGKQMMFGGDMDAFEKKMDNFGKDIERQMEAQSDQLEARADQLCYSLQILDDYETQISSSIPELAKLDALRVSYRSDGQK
ncbi:DUF2884 family protein [Neptunicella marina]|uniref:YggN family protein n=1 Tax=Neptunicella marina TaxID=2125989 RepID=A0A8J6J186_9ALTE|nr:DUF2884 family protein [Neptunicella marina]MBC3767892.1 YggN family protein [Neptunicella marina]